MRKCYFCDKHFQREKSFKKHLVKCSILGNINLLNTDEILFDLLRNLLKSNETLKSRVEKLEKKVEKEDKKMKIDIFKWLDDNNHTRITFKEFISNIEVSTKTLTYIYENGLVGGIKKIIKMEIIKMEITKMTEDEQMVPLISFTKKPNEIYVKGEDGWKLIKIQEFTDMVCKIQKKVLKQFRKDNDCLKTDRDYDLYNRKFLKVCDTKLESRILEIKKDIYNATKKNYKKLIKYDLVF